MDVKIISDLILTDVKEFKTSHGSPRAGSNINPPHSVENLWSPLPVGWVKFNVDTVGKKNHARTRVGVGGRNNQGKIIAAASRSV